MIGYKSVCMCGKCAKDPSLACSSSTGKYDTLHGNKNWQSHSLVRIQTSLVARQQSSLLIIPAAHTILKDGVLDCIDTTVKLMASNLTKSDFMWCAIPKRVHLIDRSVKDGTIKIFYHQKPSAIFWQINVRVWPCQQTRQLHQFKRIRCSLPTSQQSLYVSQHYIFSMPRPRLKCSWPRTPMSRPRLKCSWPRTPMSRSRLKCSWPRTPMPWPRLKCSWPRTPMSRPSVHGLGLGCQGQE